MRDATRNRPRTSLELTRDLAGKSRAFCRGRLSPRAVTVPRLAAESAAGDFQPINQVVDRFIEGTAS
jgi:hypothetical protein